MKEKADVLIIGGGVNGTGLAYTLAREGVENIVLVEKNYLCSGATGRCGGGIRQQWSTPENVLLAMESVRIFEGLADELNYDIELRQGGYLVLAVTEDEVEQFKKNVDMQRSLGLNTRFISPEEAKEIVPMLNVDGLLGATFNPTDGTAFPFRVVEGYARAARKMGVDIYTHTEVVGFDVSNRHITAVNTNKGRIKADTVVNCAGAYAKELAAKLGISLPNKPYRHEILVTEPLEHFLDPMVISFHYGIYFSQTKHGSIVGGIGDPEEKSSFNIQSSYRFLRRMCSVLLSLMPQMGEVRVVRQWAGLYDVTPDARPILGRVEEVDNFILACGFSGHGFMLSPAVTKHLASLIIEGRESDILRSLSYKRFEEGIGEREFSVVG